jgi:alkylhydroperoxidase family enzyme
LGDKDLVERVLTNVDTAPLSAKDRALYSFIRKMVADSTSIGQADVDVVRKAGWSDEAIYDAITVCSLFQFYNNWIDATGVSDMPAMAYEMSGHRLATQGYASSARDATR